MSTLTARRGGRPAKVLPDPPNRARNMRLALGMTIRQAADAVGIHPNALQRYEVRGFGLTLESLESLAALYKTTVAQMDPQLKNRAVRILNLLD